jgi:ketosteroid isomerase-like protein
MPRLILLPAMLFCLKGLIAQTNAANNEASIRSARAASNAAIAAHNVEGLVKCLVPDAVLVTGNGLQFVGKETVAERWKELFKQNPQVMYVRTPLQIIVSKNDTLAWEMGKWTATHSYSAGGNYTAMWCKRDGIWMTKAELFVSLEK